MNGDTDLTLGLAASALSGLSSAYAGTPSLPRYLAPQHPTPCNLLGMCSTTACQHDS